MKVKNLYIEDSIKDHWRTKNIQKKIKYQNKIFCNNYTEIFNSSNQNFRIQKKEPSLILAKKTHNLVLEAPKNFTIGIKHKFYFSHMLNCIYDCNYCFLQGMFNSAHYVIFVNYEDFFKQIKKKIENINGDSCFFSGYDCDSLALDNITDFVTFIIKQFENLDNTLLEIRSKSINIKNILKFKPNKNILPAFSINSEQTIKFHETNTPKLDERIKAIVDLQEAGWNIGLRFDPFIWVEDESKISYFFKYIFSKVNRKKVHSVTLGNFRMPTTFLKKIIKIKPDDSFLLEKYLSKDSLSSKNKNLEFLSSKVKTELMQFIDESKIYLN